MLQNFTDKTMNKKTYNLIATLLSLVAVVILIICTFGFRRELGWWAFIDEFALFMCVFSHLMAIMLARMSPYAGKTLNRASLVFGILFVISLIGEYIIYAAQ